MSKDQGKKIAAAVKLGVKHYNESYCWVEGSSNHIELDLKVKDSHCEVTQKGDNTLSDTLIDICIAAAQPVCGASIQIRSENDKPIIHIF